MGSAPFLNSTPPFAIIYNDSKPASGVSVCCMFCLTLAISYSTCAIVVFFRDLSQITGIFLQLGMWGTPILWEIGVIPEKYRIIFKLNPVFYIINGYRSAMFEKEWFFADFYSTMFFWIITAIIFVIGALIFKRLKPHFADVL